MRRRWTWLFLAAIILLLTGCSGFTDQDQTHVDPRTNVSLGPGHTVGQTFVARHGGLNGVEVWLEPQRGSQGEIQLHLQAGPQAGEDLATAALSLAQVTTPGFYRLSFAPLRDSHGRYYYVFMEMGGEGAIQVGAAPGQTYLDGALYLDHRPVDAQIAFRLAYDPRWTLLDLGRAAMGGAGLLLVATLLYLVPGGALLAWMWPADRRPWAERVGVAAGLSLALYPLLLLWTDVAGLHLGSLYAWLPMTIGLGAIAWRCQGWRPRQPWEALRRWARSDALWPDLALLVVAGLVFAVRLLVVRTLDAPLWGDSYQHTVIAQLLVDQGGLFDSWEPYTPYRTLTIHFGFPSAVALFSWATGVGSVRATLLVGQLINGLAALTLYPLATHVAGGNRWAGVGAVLVAGLLSPMPANYVNWGRYAQLAGQAILPVTIWLTMGTVGRDRFFWKTTLLAGMGLAGMTLTYYRMPFYYAAFVLAWLICWGLSTWRGKVRLWLSGIGRLLPVGGAALVLLLPWWSHLAGGSLTTAVGVGVAKGASLNRVLELYQIWRDVALYVPLPLLIVSLVALVWSLIQRRWVVVSVGLWVLGLASLVAGRLVHLPGSNLMQNFAVLIALYIPVGLLVGWLIGQAAGLVVQRWGRIGQRAVWLAITVVGLWTVAGQARVVQSSHVMVTRPDVRAMDWIRENTPPEARFLVEGFRIKQGRSAVGADAGWWIPLLAGRQNTMPPQYALLNEVPAEDDYTQRVIDLVAHLEGDPQTSTEWIQSLCGWGITHVYVGQGQGQVGAGAVQLFSPPALVASPAFSTVYQQDRVYVFGLNPQECQAGSR